MEIPFYFGLIEQGVNDVEFKHYKKEDLFYCYSINLFHFLKLNNFYYLYKDKHPKSGLFFWVFERTQSFKDALQAYSEIKND